MLDAIFHKNSVVPRFTLVACAICIVVFIGLTLGGENMTWAQAAWWGYFPDSAIWQGKPWALITSTFVHFQIWHIAFNVYWLWLLGNILEDEVGPWRWLLFFLGAAWVSAAFQLLISGGAGIGMSGVGYALFGFGWVTRSRIRGFGEILDQQAVVTFLLWLVGCAIATQLGWVNIANAAHFFGLLFGAAVGGIYMRQPNTWLPAVGTIALVAASFVPLAWCPQSMDWTTHKAEAARDAKDYDTAIYWYKRTLDQGQDKAYVWANLAQLYATKGDSSAMESAINELSKYDKDSAEEAAGDAETPNEDEPDTPTDSSETRR